MRRNHFFYGLIGGLLAFSTHFFAIAKAQEATNAPPVQIVAFGDSLSAGYGVGPGEAFPEQLQAALRDKGYDVEVINAGVSGDTTTGGLARLDWSIPAEARLVIVELGANDALRGITPELTRSNLSQIIERLKARPDTTVLLVGMLAPPNMGNEFAKAFNPIFPELAAQYDVPLYPFFLDGVAGVTTLNQADYMHPTGEGIAEIVRRISPDVERILGEIGIRPATTAD